MSTDEPEDEPLIEFSSEDLSITLHDGEAWIFDPDFLDPASEFEGVLAVQFRDGGLWWLCGKTRKWVNVEDSGKPADKKSSIRSVQ